MTRQFAGEAHSSQACSSEAEYLACTSLNISTSISVFSPRSRRLGGLMIYSQWSHLWLCVEG